jgi:hypothetical protein
MVLCAYNNLKWHKGGIQEGVAVPFFLLGFIFGIPPISHGDLSKKAVLFLQGHLHTHDMNY